MKNNWFTPGSAYDEPIDQESVGLSFLLKPFYLVLSIWIIFWLDQKFALDLFKFGIYPRSLTGFLGILFTPLIHGNLAHLSNNTLPILVLGGSLYYFYPRIAGKVVLISWLVSGFVVWLIGRDSYHIGASGLIYALAGFIFLSGILRRQPQLLALSLLVVFLYGSLVWGVLPIEETVSWEAHLAGGVSGLTLALVYRDVGPRRKLYSWDLEEAEDIEVEDEFVEETINGEENQNDANGFFTTDTTNIRYIYKPKNTTKKS